MRINQIGKYNYGNKVAFGNLERVPQNVRLNMSVPVQQSIPRTFSYSSLMTATSSADKMTEHAFSTLAYRALKDIRKFQEESKAYSEEAIKFKKQFDKNFEEEMQYHKKVMLENGENAPSEVVKSGDVSYICYYRPNGDVFKINKAKNGKLEKSIYANERVKTGKINFVEFREDGTLKEIGTGVKQGIGGIIKADKIFQYDGKGNLFSAAMNFVRHSDGSMEMTNYCKPNSRNPEYADRYVARRTVDKDGNVQYEGAIFFSQKMFDAYYPTKSFAPNEEHKIRYNI